MKLQGCGTALVTPFKKDLSIDETRLRELVQWQVDSGIHFLVPCGTTGETPALSKAEWLRVIDITTQEGQYQHFKAIAEAVDKPIMLYSVAGRTAVNIEPATLGRLAKIPNIIAVKEASGNISQIAEVFNHVPDDFLVFSGDDALTLPIISLGGVGIVSVAANEIPKELSDMTAAALKGEWEKARKLHRKYLALMQGNFIESNPMPVKAVLAMMGRVEEIYRLPMLPMKPDTRARIQKIAADVGLVKTSLAAD